MGMMAVSVGGLHDQHIGRLALGGAGVHHLAGSDGIVTHAADVSGEEQGAARAVGGESDFGHGRAEDVGRAHEAEAYAVGQLHGLAEGHGAELREALLGLFQGVEGESGGVLGTFLLVVKGRVFFLQVAGVREDDAAQIHGGRSGVDRAGEALAAEAGNPSAVVQVGVGEDDGANLSGS